MPKKGGNKQKKLANKTKKGNLVVERNAPTAKDHEVYAKAVQMLGNCQIKAKCHDGLERVCHIRGSMQRKSWINLDDIILIGLRDYQDKRGDVLYKYTQDEVRKLRSILEARDHIDSLMDRGKELGSVSIVFDEKEKNVEKEKELDLESI